MTEKNQGSEVLEKGLVIIEQITQFVPLLGPASPLVLAAVAFAKSLSGLRGVPQASLEEAREKIQAFHDARTEAKQRNEEWLATHPREVEED